MRDYTYLYRVLRYSHDPSVGERLNVGVLLICADLRYVGIRLERRYTRLSQAFSDFEGETYRGALSRIETAVRRISVHWTEQQYLFHEPPSIESVSNEIWPDGDLTFKPGAVLAGLTDDPAAELERIFDRFVTSQFSADKSQRRSDEEVWGVYRRPLAANAIESVLKPIQVRTPDFEQTFPFGFKNGNLHLLQPLSLDYAAPESIQKRAVDWLGIGTALTESPDIGTLYLLLGKPRTMEHQRQYEKAKALMGKIPISHQLIEEHQAERFAKDLAGFIESHPASEDE